MADNEAVKKQKPKKEKGEGNFLARKFKEIGSELKKVTWPTFPTVVKNTAVVLAVVAIFLVVLLVFDLILTFFVYNPLTSGTMTGTSTESILAAANGLVVKINNTFTGRTL